MPTRRAAGWSRDLIRPVFGVEADRFRVVTPDVGGGFGMKLFLYAEHVLTCYAARKLGRPVKWTSDRAKPSCATPRAATTSPPASSRPTRTASSSRCAPATSPTWARICPTFAPVHPDLRWHQRAGQRVRVPGGLCECDRRVHQHRAGGRLSRRRPSGEQLPGRAAGRRRRARPEHRSDRAAPPQHGSARRRCRTRRRWARPTTAAISARCWRPGWRGSDWAGFAARRAEAAARGKRRGLGLAYYLEATGGDPTERAEIRFAEDGFVDVYVGTQSTGQGHETAYVQLTVEPTRR